MSITHLEPGRMRGFALASAVYILVALAALAAGIVMFTTQSSVGQAMDISGSRAYQAARAGIDWAAYQVLDPYNTTGGAAPSCPAGFPSAALAGTVLAEYTVTVTCTPADYTDTGRNIRIYNLTSTATSGAGIAAVERQISAQVPYCHDLNGRCD